MCSEFLLMFNEFLLMLMFSEFLLMCSHSEYWLMCGDVNMRIVLYISILMNISILI